MMQNDMPPHWDKFITALLCNTTTAGVKSMEAARKKYGVGNDFIQALRRLDVVRYSKYHNISRPEGRMYPYLIVSPTVEQIRREMKKGIALRKSRKAVAEKQTALMEELNRHCTGKTWVDFESQHCAVPTAQQIKSDWEKAGVPVRISDTAKVAPTLAEAIEIVTAAGGTVTFGDKK